jgi:pSer/pThr/pTyr-binding forkhead associated (FHA) protein
MKFFLEIVAGPRAGSKFPLGDTLVTIGRKPVATLPFPEDSFLSGMHCSFQVTPRGFFLSDLSSTNGTFLNEQRIAQAELHPGDLISVGTLRIRVGAVEAAPVTLTQPPRPANQTAGPLEYFASLHAPLFCLVDAACDQSIPSILALSHEQYQSLYDGHSAIELAAWAPYLVQLPPNATLTKTLIDRGWGKGWASYFTSFGSFQELRHHFRQFLMVQIDNGEQVFFRFYDPRVLRDFLPTTTPNEMRVFYGPVTMWLLEAENPESILCLTEAREGPTRNHAIVRPT